MPSKDDTPKLEKMIADVLAEVRKTGIKHSDEISTLQSFVQKDMIQTAKHIVRLDNNIREEKAKNVALESEIKRRNLLVFNIPESEQNVEQHVLGHIRDELHLTDIDDSEIDDAYRIGRFDSKKTRPVIVKFVHGKIRNKVLNKAISHGKAHKADQGRLVFRPDEPAAKRRVYKENIEAIKAARANNQRIRWRGSELFIGKKRIAAVNERENYISELADWIEKAETDSSDPRGTKRPVQSPTASVSKVPNIQ